MNVIHIELSEANEFVELHHRHHKRVQGHRFSIGAIKNGYLVGVAIMGRPVARMTDQITIVEVTRLCTNGQKQACSFLYGAAARAAKALGYKEIQTFILASEPGLSLKASGWEEVECHGGGSWNRKSGARTGRREDQPQEKKLKYRKILNA